MTATIAINVQGSTMAGQSATTGGMGAMLKNLRETGFLGHLQHPDPWGGWVFDQNAAGQLMARVRNASIPHKEASLCRPIVT